jgi:hypothetical protein
MIETDIDNMPAGPELDMLIETEIFGCIPLTDREWELCKAMIEYHNPNSGYAETRMVREPLAEPTYLMKLAFRLIWPRWFSRESIGNYSQAIVEKMREDGWLFELFDTGSAEIDRRKSAAFVQKRNGRRVCEGQAVADTDALAIARAALKAVRELKKNVEGKDETA